MNATLPPDEAADGEAEEPEIECPISGEIVSLKDIDGLLDMFERLDAKNKAIYSTLVRIRLTLAEATEGDAATRRVQGKRRAAKIEMPSVSFEQSVLKQLWAEHPEIARKYMKIAELSVVMAEYKKLVNTTSSEQDFTQFRDALTAACRGRVGTPSVKIER